MFLPVFCFCKYSKVVIFIVDWDEIRYCFHWHAKPKHTTAKRRKQEQTTPKQLSMLPTIYYHIVYKSSHVIKP